MIQNKRLQTIETSLPPKQGVLFWLDKMLELSEYSYLEKVFEDPGSSWVVVVKGVGEAVRENFNDPPLKAEQLEQAVREARKQAYMLITLVGKLHERVQRACNDTLANIEVIYEQFRRMLLQAIYQDRSKAKDWESWRDKLTSTLTRMLVVRESVTSISAEYYDGHPLLFAAARDTLNEQIASLEDTLKDYDTVQWLRDWRPVTIPSITEHVKAQVASLIDVAKEQTLAAFHEYEAASELLESRMLRLRREIKKLLSSSSRQDTTS